MARDEVTRASALGLRFFDVATRDVIANGLEVTAYPLASPHHVTSAQVNASGVWYFSHLHGLDAFERGELDAAEWDSAAPHAPIAGARDYLVQVRDRSGNFLSLDFAVQAPTKRIWCWVPPAGPANELQLPFGTIPMFSSFGRTTHGMAVLRAELRDATGVAPHVLVLVKSRGKLLGSGIADDAGRIQLVFPYPEPDPTSRKLAVDLEFRWDIGSRDKPPTLSELWQQGVASAHATADRRTLLRTVELKLGVDTTLETTSLLGGGLLIVPGALP